MAASLVVVPTFLDSQISLTFPVIFFLISSIFFIILFNEFNKYKKIFYKYPSYKNSKKKCNKNWLKFPQKNWLKFPHFSSILSKIPPFFPVFRVKFPDFPSLEIFSYFSNPCGNDVCVNVPAWWIIWILISLLPALQVWGFDFLHI